jgi:pyruvate/2-oxoglutarate dehydrogenase complex dihydrolipoamide acyltransferase (E2) component
MQVLMPIVTEPGGGAVVTAWFVGDGDPVEPGQLIAEVQAEKVSQDVEAPIGGTLDGCIPINEPVAQGDPICSVTAGDAGPATGGETATVAAAPRTTPERPVSSPAARRVARERGIDLALIAGTGPGGRITEQDVLDAAAPTADAETPEAAPMTGLRAVIARNMRQSHHETAPVTLMATARLPEAATTRITARVATAAQRALTLHPDLNGTHEHDRFVPAAEVSICVAIQTDAGLVAPVLRDLAGSSPTEVSDGIEALAAKARAGTLAAADFEGGTFTITNLGAQGVEWFTPIINLPQIAILGIGLVSTVPTFDEDGAVVPRRLLPLSLTFDHAFVDGAPAAAFLATLIAELGRPEG